MDGTVVITGNPQVGQTLVADTADLGGSGDIGFQWKRGSVDVGANGGAYTVQAADVGSVITVTVTRSGNTGSVTSVPTAAVSAAFVSVTDITDVPTTATAGTPLALTGTAVPSNATNRMIA